MKNGVNTLPSRRISRKSRVSTVTGSRAIKDGLRHLVDRPDRRDLSLFRIGLYLRDRYLVNDVPFVIRFQPLFC